MKIPVDKLTRAFKMGASVKKDSDTPVRVSVYLDSTASRFLVETVRDAFVPQTTSGIVRVERLGEERIAPKTDTDVVLVLSCGSDRLESAVQELVIAGAPVCVLAESAVEVPFIEESTPMLGVVAATDKTYLLETLARWILDRTDKETAFAANFAFMRIAAANRIITSCALTNMATGAPWCFCRAPIIPLWRWRRWACSLSSLPSLDAALSPSAATRSRACLPAVL